MRSICKGGEPRALIEWKRQNAATPDNLHYNGGGFPREAVRQSLLLEQCHLCGYTLKRLATAAECAEHGHDSGHSCHIEHWVPQSRGSAASTIDYQNMLACFPPAHSKTSCDYGACYKANYDPTLAPLASPLVPNVERHFAYHESGQVQGLTAEGEDCILVLNLNHPVLVQARKAAVHGYLYPKNGKPLSAAAARRLVSEVMRPDGKQCLPAYCVAVASAALAFAVREERRAARMRKQGTTR